MLPQKNPVNPDRLIVIPLDDRIVNYECPQLLGEAGGVEVQMPPKDWLGTPWRTGQMENISNWLAEAVQAGASGIIVALDTLGYGGLVNSRRSSDTAEEVMARLQILGELKAQRPALSILAYNILMRINRSNDAEEEKPYVAVYGSRLFEMSVCADKQNMAVASPEDQTRLAALQAEIPPEIVADYLAGRARNHQVNRAMLDWTKAGVFDYLIIAQDDTVDYGWNIAEARRLRQEAREKRLAAKVSVYPGADDIGMLLVGRFLASRRGFQPRIWTRYSSARHAQVITDYEDRPMEELVKAHLGPLGGILAESPDQADIWLYLNTPAEIQGNGPDQYVVSVDEAYIRAQPPAVQQAFRNYLAYPGLQDTLREMHTPQRNGVEFARSLQQALQSGKTCALADVAFVNASDKALGDTLCELTDIAQLAAYGGWNTAGNTLGTVIGQAVIRHLQRLYGATPQMLAAHARFLFLRFVEDYLYQSHWRTKFMLETLPQIGARPTTGKLEPEHLPQVLELLVQQLRAAANSLAQEAFVGKSIAAGETAIVLEALRIDGLSLPWGRLFDLTLDIGCEYRVHTQEDRQ